MATSILCADYAYSHPDPAGMFKYGLRGVLRYFSHTPGKGLTVAERDALWAAGLGIFGLYETSADAALGGRQAGITAATTARSIAGSLGYPTWMPIAYAVDFDATASQLSGPVLAYFQGVESVDKADWDYGGIRTANFLSAHRVVTGGFQTYAWSGGQWSPVALIEQYRNGVPVAGGVVDLCRADQSVPFWKPGASAGNVGVDMPLTDADAKVLWDHLLHNDVTGKDVAAGTFLRSLNTQVNTLATAGLAAKLDALAAAVAAHPGAGTGGSLDAATVRTILDEELARADRATADTLDPPAAPGA